MGYKFTRIRSGSVDSDTLCFLHLWQKDKNKGEVVQRFSCIKIRGIIYFEALKPFSCLII